MRTPPPPRQQANTPQFWAALLDAIYFIWDKLNRSSLTIGDVTVYTGSGTPENNQTGNVGDLFLRTDGGALTTIYVKESGASTDTGWVGK